MYAVLETGSKQYRVAAGDTVEIERLKAEAGQTVTFDRVLLLNNEGKVTVGSPTVTGATVAADVVAHTRGEKKLTFKMKRRKGYHKSIGHRQELTVVKITAINTAATTDTTDTAATTATTTDTAATAASTADTAPAATTAASA